MSQFQNRAAPPPPPPPPPPSDAVSIGGTTAAMKASEIERYASILRDELRSVTQELDNLEGKADFDSEETRMRLEIRLRETQAQYRQVIEGMERQRLRALQERAREDN